MSPKDPERLRLSADSPLARSALASAAEEAPSPELSQRMAQALGLSAAAGVGLAAMSAQATAAKAASGASTASVSVVPWVAVGAVVAVLVGGTVVGVRAWHEASRRPSVPPPANSPRVAEPVPEVPIVPVPAASPGPAAEALSPGRRARVASPAQRLRDQTTLIDGARAAVSAGAAGEALGLVRQYQERYPRGVFGPEAAALRIEALVRLGRSVEARALAERFVATQPAGPLTDRVKALTRSPSP